LSTIGRGTSGRMLFLVLIFEGFGESFLSFFLFAFCCVFFVGFLVVLVFVWLLFVGLGLS
jgi:hypothetical protein